MDEAALVGLYRSLDPRFMCRLSQVKVPFKFVNAFTLYYVYKTPVFKVGSNFFWMPARYALFHTIHRKKQGFRRSISFRGMIRYEPILSIANNKGSIMGDNPVRKDVVNFNCHHCNHCCTEVVCLPSPWDVRRIEKMTGQDPIDFLEFLDPDEIVDVDDDDPTWLDVDGEKYIMALKRDTETGCHFLNKTTKYCSIYEARPLLCRLYPFEMVTDKEDKFEGFRLHEGIGCPKNTDGEFQVAPLYDLAIQDELNQEDYAELVEIFNAKSYADKQAEDFITLFSGGLGNFDQAMEDG